MIRIFCSTAQCTLQRAQLCHADQRIATLAGLLDAAIAERDGLALQLAQARAQLAEAKASTEFYLDMFVSAQGAVHGN